MSLEAFIWVTELPLDVVGSTPFRVLMKLANHAHKDGRNAWRAPAGLADELGRSERSIRRAYSELEAHTLIVRGDQRLVDQLRADRRPVVYDLNFRWTRSQDQAPDQDHGVTTDVMPHGVTDLSRGDNLGSHGVTTVVRQGTVIEPTEIKSSRGNHRGDVTPCPTRPSGHRWRTDGICAECWMTSDQLAAYWAETVNS